MSLDLLKERFGVSTSTDKKEVDKEKLNEMFNSNPMGDLESFKAQHQGELEEKDRIIENLDAETSNLAMQVLNLEKEKSTLLENINQAKWLENKVVSNTKKIYEDKIKKMKVIDATELIPVLVKVSREKQGNRILNWGEWLKIPENKYLFILNELLAKKLFKQNNRLIDETINYINRKRTRGGTSVENYNIKFGGAQGNRAFVQTGFLPDGNGVDLRLGFTVSYWVRPDEVGDTMFALGRKHNNNQRFTFGINTNKAIYVAFGGKKITTNYLAMGVNTNPNLSHLLNDDNSLKTGNWINFVITYADRSDVTDDADLKIYMNGELIKTNDDKWTQQGGNTAGLMLGARNLVGGTRSEPSTPGTFNNGWACGLDEVAIYDTGKGTSFAQEVYNGGINYNHKGASGLVAYWKMNEGSGNTVIDHSGNGYNGTLETDGTGEPTWEEIKRYK